MKNCCKDLAPPTDHRDPAGSEFTVAIIGNPNCGKTTLFNNLTGSHQRVGNWPGVTVERKEGNFRDTAGQIRVVDLPGVYTLATPPGDSSGSLDERLARDYILSADCDVVINIVDAGNLERNLYLTAQIAEMGRPMVVALNMVDTNRRNGIRIDVPALEKRLGCPVVPLVASRGDGVTALIGQVREIAARPRPPAQITYGEKVEQLVAVLTGLVGDAAAHGGVGARWLAIRVLEGDAAARALIAGRGETERDVKQAIDGAGLGDDADLLIADGRFTFANELARASVHKVGQAGRNLSDVFDKVVLNRWAGPAIFLGLIYLMFMFTINLGNVLVDFFDIAVGTVLVDGTKALLGSIGAPQIIAVLLGDGIGGGIQVVSTFIPIIGFLYLFLSVLEDSGYMARAAFLMNRLMRLVGLPGKAFVPLIVGFGCNVPAIMATRTLDRERDRILAVMMSPFMSCGARLTVYALFAAAFFPTGGQNIVFALYLIGIAAAIGTGMLLKATLLKGEAVPFVLELPPYRLPRLRDVFLHAWIRLKSFIFGAGKIIIIVVTCLSFLNSIGSDGTFGNEDTEQSMLSTIGKALVPVFEPMGIARDNWPATVGLFTGVFAKEAVVGTLDALYSNIDKAPAPASTTPDKPAGYDLLAGLGTALATIPQNFAGLKDLVTDPLGLDIVTAEDQTAAAARQSVSTGTFGAMVRRFDGHVGAFTYMLFLLLYFPCVAALGAVANEAGRKWAAFAAMWTTGLAYVVAVSFYQGATFLRHPLTSALWIAAGAAVFASVFMALRGVGRRPQFNPPPAPAE